MNTEAAAAGESLLRPLHPFRGADAEDSLTHVGNLQGDLHDALVGLAVAQAGGLDHGEAAFTPTSGM